MKISNSKKELARIISENGGWKSDKCFAAQDACGTVNIYECKPVFNAGNSGFGHGGGWFTEMFKEKKITNWHQTILSREEYFHLYPAQDADGWIEWRGGDASPVAKGAAVDVKMKNGTEHFGQLLSDACWHDSWGEASVIAYRLHKPKQVKSTAVGDYETNIAAKEELEAMECHEPPEQRAKLEKIYAPSIESLAAEYRNRKDYADRKQQEADAAKADAEVKLAELVSAGKALNLVISFAEKEPELVITDWRDLQVGDIIRCVGNWQGEDTDGVEFEVTDVECKQYDGEFAIRVDVPIVGGTWGDRFVFIRRP